MRHTATRLRLPVAAALLMLPLAVFAQSPRLVLIEEATNASCGPCAAQNPYFESYLAMPYNQAYIVPIIFHSRFPGTDVMNAAEATMHNGRVTFYSISGVPTALVNGVAPTSSGAGYAGAPSDTIALSRAAAPLAGTMSPITIGITENRSGSSATASVNVSSTTALTGKKLFTAVVEQHHYYANAGTNGEKDFYYIARKMFPNDGTALTLAAGEKKSFDVQYTIDPTWNASDIYLVSWVQDASTKEVMQVGTNRGAININSSMRTSQVQSSPDGTQWDANVLTTNPGDYKVSITTQMPYGWTNQVKIGGTAVTDGGTVSLQNEGTGAMNVSIVPSASAPGKGSLTVTLTGDHGTSVSRSFRCYSSGLQALVLPRDEGNAAIANNYNTGLSGSGYSYAIVDPGDEDIFDLNDHVIIYEVGKWALQGSEIPKLTSFFDKGGRMFIVGAEIGYGLADPASADPTTPRNPEFMRRYLHADYVADSTGPFTVYGAPNSPIGNGLSFSIANGVQNQNTPDQIAPLDGAQPEFYYGDTQTKVAGIRYADSRNRLVYLGFGLEGVGTQTSRTAVLKRGIAWLLGSDIASSVPGSPATGTTMLGAARPNPTTGMFEVPFNLERPAQCSIVLYNMRGERIATLADAAYPAGPASVRFDGTRIPAGVYTVVMSTPEHRSSSAITIVH